MQTNSGGLNRVVGGLLKKIIMKKKINKLIALIFNSDKKADNQAPKEVKPKKMGGKRDSIGQTH